MFDVEEKPERLIMVAVCEDGDEEGTQKSLDELAELIDTVGAVSVGRMVQNRERVHPGTYVGSGKLIELRTLIETLEATGIVCDDELSPAQIKNLTHGLDVKVMDRTLVILDIFAARALSGEGKIQVELAQLKYRSSRLVGLRDSLSRQGGGIGTRGPGEKKLEMDRRLIAERISKLKREVEQLSVHRQLARDKRSENFMPTVAIVGYTNAGKSTLLNRLTGSDVYAFDKLFATLDPTTRSTKTSGGVEVLMTDTVGFIRKLPHHLIDAFKSTLEEARYADIILHVVDSSNGDFALQMEVVYATLKELGVGEKPVITFFNKQDAADGDAILTDERAAYTVRGSALSGAGFEELGAAIENIVRESLVYIDKTFPYSRAADLALIRQYGQLLKEEYTPEGIYIQANVPVQINGMIDREKD